MPPMERQARPSLTCWSVIVILVGAAASPNERVEEVPVFQFDEHGTSMVAPKAAAAAARAAAGAPVDAAARSKLEATLLEDLSIACSGLGVDCRNSTCCSKPGLQCFEKDMYWATCRKRCIPGSLDPKDPPKSRTPWTCRTIGPRSPAAPQLAAATNGSKNQSAPRNPQPTAKEYRNNGTVTSATLHPNPPTTTPPSLRGRGRDNPVAPDTHGSSPLNTVSNHSDDLEIVLRRFSENSVKLAPRRHDTAKVVHGDAQPNKPLLRPALHQLHRANSNSLGVVVTAAIVAAALMVLAIQGGVIHLSHKSKQNQMRLPKAIERQPTENSFATFATIPPRTSTLSEFDVPPHHQTKRQKDLSGLLLW